MFYTERTSTAGSPHLVDVLGALDGELRQSGDVKLSAAVRVHLDVQLVGGILSQQVPEGQQRRLQPAGSDSGLNSPDNKLLPQTLTVQSQTKDTHTHTHTCGLHVKL